MFKFKYFWCSGSTYDVFCNVLCGNSLLLEQLFHANVTKTFHWCWFSWKSRIFLYWGSPLLSPAFQCHASSTSCVTSLCNTQLPSLVLSFACQSPLQLQWTAARQDCGYCTCLTSLSVKLCSKPRNKYCVREVLVLDTMNLSPLPPFDPSIHLVSSPCYLHQLRRPATNKLSRTVSSSPSNELFFLLF